MEILIARSAGFCYGVKRALRMANATIADSTNCYTLGPIIHNPLVVSDLEKKGLKVASDAHDVKKGTVIIRSHGISKDEDAYLRSRQKSIRVIDTTCPFVTRAKKQLQLLKKEGYEIFYLGDKTHPEVRGLMSYIDNDAHVFLDTDDIPGSEHRKVGLISQTTQKIELLKKAADMLLPRCEELRVFNTICKTTTVRQREALDMAGRVDVMLILGGKNSSNTRKLAEICREVLDKTYHVESVSELKNKWFSGVKRVGITAGASTPREHINDVVNFLRYLEGGNT